MASGTGASKWRTSMTSELYTSEHLTRTTTSPFMGLMVSVTMVMTSILALSAF
jgi:hypothetical protein